MPFKIVSQQNCAMLAKKRVHAGEGISLFASRQPALPGACPSMEQLDAVTIIAPLIGQAAHPNPAMISH